MKRLLISILACAALSGSALPGSAFAATDVLDQSYQPTSGSGYYLGNTVGGCCGVFTQVLAQTFTAGLTGNLDKVSLWMSYCDPAGAAIIQITPVDANGVPVVSTVLGSGSFAAGPTANIGCSSYTPTNVWVTVSLATPVAVRSGTKYAIVVNTTYGTGGYTWVATGNTTATPGYAAGSSYASSNEPPTFSLPNGASFAFQTFVIPVADNTPPVTTATPAPGTLPPGVSLVTVNATATIKSTTGATLGTIAVTCFDTFGLAVKLNAVDDPGGSVASLSYAASGAQAVTSATVRGASASVSITAVGLTTLTFAATDVAGNSEATKSESIVVGQGDDGVGFGCAAPTPAFTMPAHGTLVVSGTATSNGFTFPFSKTITI